MTSESVERRGWVLTYLAPALLVLVALNQIVLAFTTDLSPWKGGGFGMFSTIPGRYINAYAIGDWGESRLPTPPERTDLMVRAHFFPIDRNLRAIAERMASSRRTRTMNARSFRIEVWATRFDRERGEYRVNKLREYVYEVPRAGG